MWILVITLITYHGVSISNVEFSSKQKCLDGGNSYLKSLHTRTDVYLDVSSVCIPK